MIGSGLIPISDDDTGIRRTSYVVWLLLLVNIAVFIYELSLGDRALTRFVAAYGARPVELTNLEDLPPLIDYPVLVTVFTSIFMHGGLLHLGANMLFLWIFGDNIEDVMGHLRFLIFYLLCGVIAVFSQVIVNPDSSTPIIGASGAISGVMGAYLVLFPRVAIRVAAIIGIFPLLFRLPAVVVIGLWFVIQALSGYASLGMEDIEGGTAFFAHIGGFIAGMLLVWLFADARAVRRQNAGRRGVWS